MNEAISARREAFRTWVKAHGGVAAVARKAEVPPTTLYSYLAGGGSLKGTTQDAIAHAFGVITDDLFTDRSAPVIGFVGAGDAAHYYASGDSELDRVRAPDNATENTVAAEIRGGSLGGFFDGWLVFFDEVRSPITPDLLGELCVVGLPDDRVVVKKVQAARSGLYHLISATEPPMLDQEVAWAARVTGMRPR
jgi:hypothetical protein